MNVKKSFEFIIKALGEALKDKAPFLVIVPHGSRVGVMATENIDEFLADCMLKNNQLEDTVFKAVFMFLESAAADPGRKPSVCDCEKCDIRKDCPIERSNEAPVRTGLSFAGRKFEA